MFFNYLSLRSFIKLSVLLHRDILYRKNFMGSKIKIYYNSVGQIQCVILELDLLSITGLRLISFFSIILEKFRFFFGGGLEGYDFLSLID